MRQAAAEPGQLQQPKVVASADSALPSANSGHQREQQRSARQPGAEDGEQGRPDDDAQRVRGDQVAALRDARAEVAGHVREHAHRGELGRPDPEPAERQRGQTEPDLPRSGLLLVSLLDDGGTHSESNQMPATVFPPCGRLPDRDLRQPLRDRGRPVRRGRPYHHERTVRRALGDWRPGSALDVACGTGLSTRALAALGIPVPGPDVAAAMVARARADTGLPYAVGSGEALPVADGAVELVTVGSACTGSTRSGSRPRPPGCCGPAAACCSTRRRADAAVRAGVSPLAAGGVPRPLPVAAPRHDGAHFDAGGRRFGAPVTERWPDGIPFTRDGFAAYLATQSNTLDRPAEETLTWLRSGLTPFFPARGTRTITFQASYRLLRRATPELVAVDNG